MTMTLSNKLYEFETLGDMCKKAFKIALAQDITQLSSKLKRKGLFYTLSPHEREVADKVQQYYNENSKLLLNESC